MPVLPQEILSLIVPHIEEDRPLLRSLLFVSKSFRDAARSLLFRWVYVTLHVDSPSNTDIQTLLNIFSGDTNILKDIRRFAIIFDVLDGLNYDNDESPDLRPLARDAEFAVLLQTVSQAPIRGVELHWSSRFDLSRCSQEILEGFWRIRRNPSLRSFVISHSTGVPYFLIAGVPSEDRLTSLVLEPSESDYGQTFFHPFPPPRSDSHSRVLQPLPSFLAPLLHPPPAHSMTLTRPPMFSKMASLKIADPQLLDCILKAYHLPFASPTSTSDSSVFNFSFPSLLNLSVGRRPGLSAVQRHVVQAMIKGSPLLETFSLIDSFNNVSSPLKGPVDILAQLCQVHHLRRLRLGPCSFGESSAQGAVIADALRQSLPLPKVESLSLTFRWAIYRLAELDSAMHITTGGWAKLKETLLQLPSLRHLFLNFVVTQFDPSSDDGQEFDEDGPELAAILDLLSLDGRLDIKKVVFTGEHWFRIEPSCWEWADVEY